MSIPSSRRSPLQIIRALREAKLRGQAPLALDSCRRALAESLERRQMLSVTTAGFYTSGSPNNKEGTSVYIYPHATTNHDPAPTYWTIDYGDGTTPVTTTVSGSTSLSHTYVEAGNYNVVGQLSDATSGSSYFYCSATATIADQPLSAVGGNTTIIGATEGISYYGTVAHFSDGNPYGVASDYTASIICGDGATVAGTVAADLSGGFDVVMNHGFPEYGSYAGSVHISDAGGSALTMYLATGVSAAPITATAGTGTFAVGQSRAVTTITFADANTSETGSNISASIHWGDGNTSTGTLTSLGGGSFSVQGTHSYSSANTFTGYVTVTHTGGVSASASYTATVVSLDSLTVSDSISGNSSTASSGTAVPLIGEVDSSSSLATFSISGATTPNNSTAAGAVNYEVLDSGSTIVASGVLGTGASVDLAAGSYTVLAGVNPGATGFISGSALKEIDLLAAAPSATSVTITRSTGSTTAGGQANTGDSTAENWSITKVMNGGTDVTAHGWLSLSNDNLHNTGGVTDVTWTYGNGGPVPPPALTLTVTLKSSPTNLTTTCTVTIN